MDPIYLSKIVFCLLLLLDFGLGQLKSFMSIITYYAGFKRPTILKVHPPISGMPGSRLKDSITLFFFLQVFVSNELCVENSLLGGRGVEPKAS